MCKFANVLQGGLTQQLVQMRSANISTPAHPGALLQPFFACIGLAMLAVAAKPRCCNFHTMQTQLEAEAPATDIGVAVDYLIMPGNALRPLCKRKAKPEYLASIFANLRSTRKQIKANARMPAFANHLKGESQICRFANLQAPERK